MKRNRFNIFPWGDRWYQIQDSLTDDFVDVYKLDNAQTVEEWLNNLSFENEVLKGFIKAKGYDVDEILKFGFELGKSVK